MLASDPALSGLTRITAPLVDLEVRGVPALAYFGQTVWNEETYGRLDAGAGRKYYMLGGKGACMGGLGRYGAVRTLGSE